MTYGRLFYRSRRKWVLAAAESLLPTILSLAPVRTMVDVGCGTGLWVKSALDRGVDAMGIDGPWVRRQDLEVPPARFTCADLDGSWDLGRSVDLALSLEVGEHLAPETAPRFVERLTRLAPLVVFSAAIPGQGGQCHINEQWPGYWIEHFRRSGYEVFDVLRPRIWGDRRIPYWYRQNILVFAARAHGELIASLKSFAIGGDFRGASLVHPDHAMRALQYPGLGALARAFPYALVRSLAALPNWRLRHEPAPLPVPEREPFTSAP